MCGKTEKPFRVCEFILLVTMFAHPLAVASPGDYFKIMVVDAETSRGVPLVELKTTNNVRCYTDSNGIVAFCEPGLMDQVVYFHIRTDGYEYPVDFLGYRGNALKVTKGGSAILKIKRLNIAERLYRITGEGIYRDSILVGHPVPLREPLLNGQVMGQDTVVATPYRGRIYWFWGDTDRPSYPLGNFAVSGAISELPGRGGLDPSIGVELSYFVDEMGFCKPMCPVAGEGMKWLEGVMTVTDDNGNERLAARYASMKDLGYANEWGLVIFNDEKKVFERIARFDAHGPHTSAHPFRVRVGGEDYYYLFPTLRVRANLKHLADLNAYENFSCLAAGVPFDKSAPKLDRQADGRLNYGWKGNIAPTQPDLQQILLGGGSIRPQENWFWLHDMERGTPIKSSPIGGSVCWNEYRQRWVTIASGKPGEIWFAEADTPVGPWVYARKVVSHDRYNFYNPAQHPFFDQDRGRVVYFEGTYTASFSDAPMPTPRYNYNQMMYRLDLSDPRLFLPVPVYRVKGSGGQSRHLTREGVESEDAWERIEDIPFFAFTPDRHPVGLIPVYGETAASGTTLRPDPTASEKAEIRPLFYALPVSTNSILLAEDNLTGTWRCTAKASGDDQLAFSLGLKQKGDEVKGTAGTAEISSGRLKDGQLELTIEEANVIYILSGAFEHGKLTGKWKLIDGTSSGTWQAERSDSVPQALVSPAVAFLYEYRLGENGPCFYSTEPHRKDAGLRRSREPLCRVWRNPMSLLVLDIKAKPVRVARD